MFAMFLYSRAPLSTHTEGRLWAWHLLGTTRIHQYKYLVFVFPSSPLHCEQRENPPHPLAGLEFHPPDLESHKQALHSQE